MKRAEHLLFCIVIVGAIFLSFLPSLGNEFVTWDDYENFVNNSRYRGFSRNHLSWMFTTSLRMGHYQPLSWLTLALDYTVWGLNPFGYHLTNLVLHTFNALLLYAFILTLFKSMPSFRDIPFSMAAKTCVTMGVLFYALHPLRVESVVWATERRDVLSGFFFLLTMLCYLKMSQQDHGLYRRWAVLAFLCFAGSLLAKATAMTLPVVLLILDLYPFRRHAHTPWRYLLREKIPFFALSTVIGVVAVLGQKQVSAMEIIPDHGLIDRCMQAAYGLCFYVTKTLLPFQLSPLYLMEQPFDPTRPIYILCMIVVIVVTLFFWAVRHRYPWAVTCWMSYAVLISPVLGFAQGGSQITADRYTYIPSLPFSLLMAGGLVVGWNKWKQDPSLVNTAACGGSVILLLLGCLTYGQTRIWHNGLTLWNHAIRLDPDHWYALNNRAQLRQEQQDYFGAMEDLTRAITLNPDYATALYNRGVMRSNAGDSEGAMQDLNAALDKRPDFSEAYNHRGTLYERRQETQMAIVDYTRAIRYDPNSVAALYNRGSLYQRLGFVQEAMKDFDAAIALNPRFAMVFNNRGFLKQQSGDLTGALQDYGEAIRRAPQGAEWFYVNRANVLVELGQKAEAIEDLKQALQAAPGDWPYRDVTEERIREMKDER
jgi:tetratricopeptide (TPR) repeat protein